MMDPDKQFMHTTDDCKTPQQHNTIDSMLCKQRSKHLKSHVIRQPATQLQGNYCKRCHTQGVRQYRNYNTPRCPCGENPTHSSLQCQTPNYTVIDSLLFLLGCFLHLRQNETEVEQEPQPVDDMTDIVILAPDLWNKRTNSTFTIRL